jgi:hypothetical protein
VGLSGLISRQAQRSLQNGLLSLLSPQVVIEALGLIRSCNLGCNELQQQHAVSVWCSPKALCKRLPFSH